MPASNKPNEKKGLIELGWFGDLGDPEHAKTCAPPTHHAFDIDIYDCPCGHMYGDHEYNWLSTAVHPEKAMIIIRCEKCGGTPRV